MKKRIFCLFFALLLLLPLCLTSCSQEPEEDTGEREEFFLTLYAITDAKTTPEGIQRTQEVLNEYLVDHFKTHLELRLFTKDNYQTALDEMYAKFELREQEKKDAEKAALEAARAEEEAEKSMSAEELLKKQEEARIAQQEEALAAEQAEKDRLARIAAGEESGFAEVQMDLLYIDGEEDYYSYINEGKLVPLDNYLKLDHKIISDYLHANLLTSAKVSNGEDDAATYGIPNNTAVAETGWYYVFNTALAQKYNFDLTINPPRMDVFRDYINQIARSEQGVIPIANYGPAAGVDFYEDIPGFPIAAINSEYGPFEARGATQTFSESTTVLQAHFKYMAEFRAAGYFVDRPMTQNDNFFLDIREGTPLDKAQWEEQGYTVLTYRRPTASSSDALKGLFGISSYCEYPDRAMEVLRALTTNEQLHNAFAFGVEGTNYSVNADGLTVTMLRDDYTMDFARTGNTLLGYLPAGYTAAYKETIKNNNLASKLSGFSCLYLNMDEDGQAWFDQIAALGNECESEYKALCAGNANYAARCAALQAKLDAVDLEGFISEILSVGFKLSSKEVRSADKANFTTSPAYYLDQLPQVVEPEENDGEIDGETGGDTGTDLVPDQTEAENS